MRLSNRVRLIAWLAVVIAAGCSSSDTSSDSASGGVPATDSRYKGIFTGPHGEGGTLDVTVSMPTTATKSVHALATPSPVTAAIAIAGGGSVSATGTFDSATG